MNGTRLPLAVLLALSLLFCGPANADMLEDLKPAIVNLTVSYSRFFGVNQAGQFNGTGFLVDKDAGLLATNRHVAREFPAQINIVFVDGSSTLGKVVYYDASHDFSIVSYDPASIEAEAENAILGDFFSLEVGDDVTLVGNNEGEEYSVKHGVVVDLVKDKGDRHSMTFQTSFDRTGGSSGSPVFNNMGQVVGLHYKGTDTSSFELPINYVKDKLDDLRARRPIKRGDIGVQLEYVKIAEAESYLDFPGQVIESLKQQDGDLKYLLMVKALVSGLPAEKCFMPGDIIYSVDGVLIKDNMYRFDKLVDGATGKKVQVEVFRRGKKIKCSAQVKNAEDFKIRKFITFAGGTFHPLTPQLRLSLDVKDKGVYLCQTDVGSTMGTVGNSHKRAPDRKGVLVTAINGAPVNDLDDLIKALTPLKHKDKISMTFKDFFMAAPPTVAFLILDLQTSPLTVFNYDEDSNEWLTSR